MKFTTAVGVCLCVLSSIPCTSAGDKQEIVGFQRLKLDAEDLFDFTNLDIYKFQLDVAKGGRFRIAFQEQKSKEAEPMVRWHHEFENAARTPPIIRVGFLREDRKLQGALLSQDEWMHFRVSCEGCRPSGLSTILPVPLQGVELTERFLMVHKLPSKTPANADTMELISLYRRGQQPGVVNAPGYPRASLVVQKLP